MYSKLRYYGLFPIIENDFENNVKEKEESKAMNDIIIDQLKWNADNFYYEMINNYNCARKVWKDLKEHFEGTSLVRTMRIVK
jgi:hypothetical protein